MTLSRSLDSGGSGGGGVVQAPPPPAITDLGVGGMTSSNTNGTLVPPQQVLTGGVGSGAAGVMYTLGPPPPVVPQYQASPGTSPPHNLTTTTTAGVSIGGASASSGSSADHYSNSMQHPSFFPQQQQYQQQQQAAAAAVHQQQQQQQPQQYLQPPVAQALTPLQNPMNMPWTLGSTDGSYAISVAFMIQQQQQMQQHNDAAANSTSTTAPSTTNNSTNNTHNTTTNGGSGGGGTSSSPAVSGPLIVGGGGQSNNHSTPSQQQQQGEVTATSSAVPPPPAQVLSGGLSGAGSGGGSGVAIMSPGGGGAAAAAAGTGGRAQTAQQSSSEMLAGMNPAAALAALSAKQSLFQDRLFRQPSAAVEAVLAASCEVMGFDIAEMWLRTGSKTHQLTNSHLRPTALEDSVRRELVDVYYGTKSSERTHRLSPALCKRAKEANDVVWITAHTSHGAEALRCSISNVRSAVAIPVCHEGSNTNITIIFFSIRRIIVRPAAVEFFVHMALAAGAASVNSLAEDGLVDRDGNPIVTAAASQQRRTHIISPAESLSQHVHRGAHHNNNQTAAAINSATTATAAANNNNNATTTTNSNNNNNNSNIAIRHPRVERFSVTGAQLDLQWRQLHNVEYLTDGGNSWIHTAVFNGKPVVVKTLKPECQDVAAAINEIEGELDIHSRLNHANICSLIGAGTTSKGVRFVVLERLDGGTLTQMLGYDTRIRDRRRRFWRRKHFSFVDVLRIAKSIAEAMSYCHEEAIPGSILLHRDLKPCNIGFTLDGTVKILDFGLAKICENSSVDSDQTYTMSGETGSLRYMAPEVAEGLPYNFRVDVYSFGIILWEINACKKPFEGLNRELFYERIVHGGERPPLNKKWPTELTSLMSECWDTDMNNRPKFRDIVKRLDSMMNTEKGGPSSTAKKKLLPRISGMIDRHSTWF